MKNGIEMQDIVNVLTRQQQCNVKLLSGLPEPIVIIRAISASESREILEKRFGEPLG
jgi:hypothetical protein